MKIDVLDIKKIRRKIEKGVYFSFDIKNIDLYNLANDYFINYRVTEDKYIHSHISDFSNAYFELEIKREVINKEERIIISGYIYGHKTFSNAFWFNIGMVNEDELDLILLDIFKILINEIELIIKLEKDQLLKNKKEV